MSLAEYAARVAKYYPSYVGGGLMYLALAAVIYGLFNNMNKSSANAAHS